MLMLRRAKSLLKGYFKPALKPVVIIGTGAKEYALYNTLMESGEFEVKFFITDDPWAYKSYLGVAQLRSAVDLAKLCEKHSIQAIYYLDESLLQSLPSTSLSPMLPPVETRRR